LAPFAEVGVNGHQLNAEADPHQKAEEDHPSALLCVAISSENDRTRQRHHKGQAAAQFVRQRRKQTGANKQPHKGGGGEGGLVGDAEDALLAGMENILCQQPGADIPGLKKIVELKAAQRQQGDKRP
jgi:hypothetical protein